MDIIIKIQNRLECKINYTLPALLPNKIKIMQQGLVTSGEGIRNKRVIPALATIQGVAAIGGMMIKGINALVNAKRASSFNNAIKLINENVQITHDRLITLENQTAMMAKAIIPVLKDFKQQINNVVLLPCGCLSLNPFIEISIWNNSSSSDVLNIQASISISPKFESK